MNTNLLNEVKNRLNLRKMAILNEQTNLRKEDPFLDPDHATDNASSDTDAFEQNSHERVEALEQTLSDELQRIERTLLSIEHKTYGTCEECGKPIPETRLRAIPTTRYCIDCKEKLS